MSDKAVVIANETLQPVDSVRNLGVYLYSELNMRAHITRVVGLESWTWTQVGLESDFLRTWTGLGLEGQGLGLGLGLER